MLFSPLGEAALFVSLVGTTEYPNPNGTVRITVPAKEFHTENLSVYNITEVRRMIFLLYGCQKEDKKRLESWGGIFDACAKLAGTNTSSLRLIGFHLPAGALALLVSVRVINILNTSSVNVLNVQFPESYVVVTDVFKIVPDKFEGYYEISHPNHIKVWGEASATCRWKFVCYESCELQAKVSRLCPN